MFDPSWEGPLDDAMPVQPPPPQPPTNPRRLNHLPGVGWAGGGGARWGWLVPQSFGGRVSRGHLDIQTRVGYCVPGPDVQHVAVGMDRCNSTLWCRGLQESQVNSGQRGCPCKLCGRHLKRNAADSIAWELPRTHNCECGRIHQEFSGTSPRREVAVPPPISK